ncbi:MAG TPA: helix-turn-helix domain-containing protein [Acidobacteriota bacterium]|nr:helix-turn-helix domain-containing protein [Acidobacteriota bacterium]
MQARIHQVLESMGLSPNERKTYLSLIDHGTQSAGKLAKFAHMDRSSCYYALRQLQQRGLVAYHVDGAVKMFAATSPTRLLENLKEQEADLKEIVPLLKEKHGATKKEGQVRLFRGIKGVKSIFMDIIRSHHDNYVFGSEGQFSARMPEFVSQFNRLKKENDIKTFMLIRKGRKEEGTTSSVYRYIDVEESHAVTNIYGDKVAIIVWTEEPEGIIIENAATAKAYKSYFDFMWKFARK